MQSGVYVVTNRVTGERYVGSSFDIAGRWSAHRSAAKLKDRRRASRRLLEALNLYGPDSFECRPLVLCAPEHLVMYETLALRALNPEYNVRRKNAGTNAGISFTEEAKARMRQHQRFEQHTVRGVTGTIYALAKHFKATHPLTAHARVRRGWTVEEAVTAPAATRDERAARVTAVTKRNARKYSVQGVTGTLSELTAHFGVCKYDTVRKRVDSGWAVEAAVTTPGRRYAH